MSFISKLKPRIKPRLGGKVADASSTDANIQSSSTNSSPTSVSGTSSEDATTSHPALSLDKNDPDPPSVGPETSAPAVKTINNEDERSSSKASQSPVSDLPIGNGVDLNVGKLGNPPDSTGSTLNDSSKSPDSQKAAVKPKEVINCIREKPKPRIIGLKHYKPVIKKQVRPTSTLESPVSTQPAATFGRQPVIKCSESNDVATPSEALGISSNKNESKLIKDTTEVLDFSTKLEAQKPRNDTNKLLSVNETLSPIRLDGNCSETINLESGKLQKQGVVLKLQDITPSSTTIEENESEDLRFLDNQVKYESDPPKSGINTGIHRPPDGIKKHPLIKRPPKIARKAPKLDKSRTAVSHNSDKLPTVAPPEKVSLATTDGNEQKIIATVEDGVSDELDVENVSYIPIIDTTKSRSQTSSDVAPLSTVSSNTDNVTSDCSGKSDTLDYCELSNKSTVDKTKSGSSTKSKTSKSDMEDVRTLCAISAVDYLRRHDHALGDSIIRRLIIGDKNMQNRNLKATMCSSCNPQTLQKCLASLWSFHKDELQVILKKSAERQKAPLTFANFSGKPLFKPSLGRQRAPTLTASTYGKMCFEVKEGLAKKYGPNAPELSKLRMLDLIFYNPSDNPMSKPSGKANPSEDDPSETASNKSSSRQTSSTSGSTMGSDQSDSDIDDPEGEGEGSNSTGCSSPVNDNEQNNNNVPVPQVKIGDEGQIILAPESLVLKQRESEVLNNPVIHESDFAGLVRKRDNLNRTSWSFEETVKFYKSLHGMGTDFTSMLTLFPNRTRKNLKSKFKREERKNSALIDKVLSAQGQNLSLADVEKDLATDKTLRRLCIETAARKYSPGNSISSILKPSRRRKKECFSDDDEELSNLWKAGRSTKESTPALASSIPNNLRSRSANLQKTSENETEKKSSKKESNGKKEENTIVVAHEQNLPSKEISLKLESKESGETFKKPVGRPPTQRKRKLEKKIPNIIKRGRKSRAKEPPRIHTICLDDFDDMDDEDEDDSGSSAESDPLAMDGTSDRDDCFVIETNYEHESFNCIKSVKFSVDNPDWPVDVNATIEHKGPSDEPVTEVESVVDESGEVVQVVTININQLPSYLEQTGAVVIEAHGS